MTPTEYWLETFNELLCEVDAYNLLTDEQKQHIARGLETSHECYGQAFYSPPATDMINHEKRKLEQRIKELESDVYKAELNFKKNVAMRWKCDIQDVTLEDNGNATVR